MTIAVELGGHTPVVIVPATCNDTCNACYRSFNYGQWIIILSDARNRDDGAFRLCPACAKAIGDAVPHVPTSEAPDPEEPAGAYCACSDPNCPTPDGETCRTTA